MNKKIVLYLFLIIFYRLSAFCCNDSFFEERKIQDEDTEISVFKNEYTNQYYGFSISIPRGLVARTNPLPAIDRGCSVLLSNSSKAIAFFYARDITSSDSIETIQNESVSLLKERDGFGDMVNLCFSSSTLGGLKANKYIAEYTCKTGKEKYVEIQLLALHKERQLCYEASLVVKKENFTKYEKMFYKMLKQWRLESIVTN